MKQVLLIDLQNTLVEVDFDEDTLFNNLLESLKDKFNLEQTREFQKQQFSSDLQKMKAQNLQEKWELLLNKIFDNCDIKKCEEYLKSQVQLSWKKKTKKQILPCFMDNVCYADFHYLNVCYDIIFFLEGDINPLKKVLIETTLEEYIDLSKIRYFKNSSQISLLKIIDPQNVHFVAQDIQKIIQMLQNYDNFKNFNFQNQFIHVYYQNLCRDDYKKQQELLFEKNIQHDIYTFKNLYNKMETIKKMQQKNQNRKDVLKVGVYLEDKLYKDDQKGYILMDKYPIVYTHFDPLSKNNQKDINFFMCKYSYLMNDYKMLKQNEIDDLLHNVLEVLKAIETKNNHKVLVVNNVENFMVFAERQAMADFFVNLFEKEEFKKSLKENFGQDLTLQFPSTFTMNEIKAQNLKDQMKEKKMEFPIVIKSSYCITILSDYSHEVIVIRSEDQVEEFFQKEKEKLEAMLPIVVQQYILDLQDIQKIYYLFDKKKLSRYRGIDDVAEGAEAIDGTADLKKQSEIAHFSETETKLIDFIGKELNKCNFINLGLDLCCKKNSEQFFVIDTNADGLGWMAHGNKQQNQNEYYENMIKFYKNFNQIQYND